MPQNVTIVNNITNVTNNTVINNTTTNNTQNNTVNNTTVNNNQTTNNFTNTGFIFQVGVNLVINNPAQERDRYYDEDEDEVFYERLPRGHTKETAWCSWASSRPTMPVRK